MMQSGKDTKLGYAKIKIPECLLTQSTQTQKIIYP